MIKTSSILAAIVREFISNYLGKFIFLFVLILFEGMVAASAVLALVPLADFLVDPNIGNPNRITKTMMEYAVTIGLSPSFWLFGLLFVAFNILKSFLDIATRFCCLSIKYAITRDLVDKTLSNFFRARWGFFARADQGQLLNTFNKELTTVGDTLGALATQLAQFVQLIIYLAVPFWLNASMTLATITLATILGLPFLLFHKLSYRLGLRSTKTANAMMGSLNEVLGAARIILGFARQNESKGRVLSDLDKHIYVTVRSQSLTAAVPLVFQPIGILSVVIAFGISLERGAPFAETTALLWSLLRALPLMGGLMSLGVTIRTFWPSYEQLASLRKEAAKEEEIPGPREFSVLQTGIELRGVYFAYPGRIDTLRKINLTIPKGKVTAIVGESGSGKSTITDLILGLQSPAYGNVLIDGVPLPSWRQNSFREKIGYVPQEPFLFHESIRNNLLWSAPNADDNALWEACRLAYAEEFIRQMPEGLDTIVGDRGIRLSGGQRQRIALARAFVRKPEVLILDEATSSLDHESEGLIQRSIERVASDTTILVVAHRLTTIASADKIYVLHLGQVVEEGNFAELAVKAGGYLGRMLAAQESSDRKTTFTLPNRDITL